MPNLPSGKRLQQQHLQPVLHGGALGTAFLHEEGFVGIVQQVVEQVLGRQQFVGDVRAEVYLGIHAYGRAVDDDRVLGHHFGRQVGIGQCFAVPLAARDIGALYAQVCQAVVDGFRGAARAQQQGLAVMGLQQGFDGLREV